MDVIKRNTDYALRAILHLARNYGGESISSRVLADAEDVPYELLCKLMQKLNGAGLVKSEMGPKGGFSLNRLPEEITLRDVVATIQGPISINRCLVKSDVCERQYCCVLSRKLAGLQEQVDEYLGGVTLGDFLKENN